MKQKGEQPPGHSYPKLVSSLIFPCSESEMRNESIRNEIDIISGHTILLTINVNRYNGSNWKIEGFYVAANEGTSSSDSRTFRSDAYDRYESLRLVERFGSRNEARDSHVLQSGKQFSQDFT